MLSILKTYHCILSKMDESVCVPRTGYKAHLPTWSILLSIFFANRTCTIIFAEILKLDVCHYFPAESDLVVSSYRN